MGQKTFTSYIKNSKTYTLIAVGLVGVITWVESIAIPKIVMTLSMFTTQLRIINAMVIPKIVVSGTNSLIKLIFYPTGSINIRPIILISIVRQTIRFLGSTFTIPYIYVNNVLRQNLRILGEILKIPKIILEGVMTIAVFYTLSVYDPQGFDVLDSFTLSSMDYTI